MSDPEDFIEEDDLFGDDDGEVQPVRQLSDEELDSGDDEDRNDRTQNDDMDVDTGPTRAARIMDVELGRQTVPLPADGEVSHPQCCVLCSLTFLDSHISLAELPWARSYCI